MTTPSGFFPTGAANYGGLAAFSAKTVEQWQAEISGNLTSAAAMLQNGIQAFIALVSQVPIIGPIAAGALQFVQDLLDKIVQLFNTEAGPNNTLAQLGSAVQSGLQGILPAISHNFDGTMEFLSGVVQNLDGTWDFTPDPNPVYTIIHNLDGTVSTVAQALQDAAAAGTAFVGSTLTAAANAGQQILNGLFGAFGIGAGGAVSGASPAQAISSVVAAQQNIADNAAGLAALQALLAQAANGGGLSVNINFSDYPDGSLPSTFTVDSGAAAISSGYAVATTSPAIVQYNDDETETDYQAVSGIFSSVSSFNSVGLRCRVNSAGTTDVRAVYNVAVGGWSLTAIVAGSSTVLSTAYDTFTPGAVYTLIAGTVGGNRVFQVLKNGTALTFSTGGISYTDTGNVSQVGASYRRGGWIIIGTAPKMSTWALADNTPPAVVGSGFRAYRTSSTTLSNSSGSPALFPSTWFDTVDYNSSDLPYDASTNKITVSVSGHYRIQMVLHATSYVNWGASNYLFGTLYVNGTRVRTGNNLIYGYKLETGFDIYLEAGDYVQLGYVSNTNFSANGDASGLITWWSVTFLNRGTLS
ncbi:DUF7257 domain-containing protein [Mycobacterium marinum]|uniref:DUF7257 domain-containing protein n=1 Tax=Mycobacterium marinum TaxID=1781 RepID=UPI0011401272|nr:hypothetical protein [Mycobacterium marinum]